MKKLLLIVLCLLIAAPAGAQSFSTDARRIALGGIGEKKNPAADFAGDPRQYRSIVVPLGLFQVFKNIAVFNPGDEEFDPIQAMELIASPIHYTFGRDGSGPGALLVNDIVNARLSRDLNRYRGFTPRSSLSSQGLSASSFGYSFKGFYFGTGPYVSIGTAVDIDQQLIDILSSSTDVYVPNTTFLIENRTDGQAAAAITGGYRTKLPLASLPATGNERDGLYVSGNYNYLYGIHYDTVDLGVRFDTNAQGLVTLAPTTTPLVIDRTSSNKGAGFSLDLGSALVLGSWDFRFAANGVANRITWENFSSERVTLNSLVTGGDFTEVSTPAPTGKRKLTLPVQYVSGVGYNSGRWYAGGEVSHGLEDTELRGGAEYRLGLIELRGGGRYSRDLWHPAYGVGLNLLPNFGIDFAQFTTASNIEKERRQTIALSLRIGRGADQN